MFIVSCRLLACSRPISSWMLTSPSEVTCLSSSIFASSSAIGCSKSRNETAMRAGYPNSAPVGGERRALARRGRRVDDLQRAAPEHAFELLEQLAAGAHRPLGSEGERAPSLPAPVFHGERAPP